MDLGVGDVADDQERRVIEGFAVLAELAVGVGQVAVFPPALVFPGELAAPPDIGKAVLALRPGGRGPGDGDALLKGVFGPGRVVFGGGRLAEHPAQIEEVFLAGGALGQLDRRPLGDEFNGGELARRHGGILEMRGMFVDAGACTRHMARREPRPPFPYS